MFRLKNEVCNVTLSMKSARETSCSVTSHASFMSKHALAFLFAELSSWIGGIGFSSVLWEIRCTGILSMFQETLVLPIFNSSCPIVSNRLRKKSTSWRGGSGQKLVGERRNLLSIPSVHRLSSFRCFSTCH